MPFGAKFLISDITLPFSSNNSSGLYDLNHFSNAARCSVLKALTGKGTWCALKLPSIALPSHSFGQVQPFGVLTIKTGHCGLNASSAFLAAASFLIFRIFSIAKSINLAISW
ncbi:Uncharacterised protein, partial [Metamycoplasma alkalescens]